MNNITKLVLATALLATSGFAGEINGIQNIKEGARLNITNNDVTVVVPGTITLAGSETLDKGAVLNIGADKTLTIKGGTISYDGVGDYKPTINLNGKLVLEKNEEQDPTITVTNVKIIGETGSVDMGALREFNKDEGVENIKKAAEITTITGFKPENLKSVTLPFNCDFGDEGALDLSNVKEISYTRYIEDGVSAPDVVECIIKMITTDGTPHGDYQLKPELGVTISPEATVNVIDILESGDVGKFDLENITDNGAKFNKTENKVDTLYLSDVPHEIETDTTYNFGFIGENPIKVAGEGKAIFKGDSSEYAPVDASLVLPSNVEFGATNSLFPISQEYGNVTFTAGAEGSEITNTVPAGETITITDGITLGAHHILNIEGELTI